MRAVSLTWQDAVVCFGSAATFHGFPVRPENRTHVIVPRRVPGRGGIVTHNLRLDQGEVERAAGGLVTSRQRTLFDCIGRLDLREAERLVAWAVTREVLSSRALEDAVMRRHGWWGNTARRQALDDARRGTLSAAERRLARILRRGNVTGWACDQQLWDELGLIGRADVLFTQARLVIEVDGFAHHGRDQFQRDRTRQNRLVAAGYTVLRFTWSDLTDHPDAVLTQIRLVLRRLRP